MRPKPSMTLDGFVAPSCSRSWVCPCRAVFHIGFRLVHRSALLPRAGEVDPGHLRVHATAYFVLLYTRPMLLMLLTRAVFSPFIKCIRVDFLLSGPPPYFSFFQPVHRLPVIPYILFSCSTRRLRTPPTKSIPT